MLPSLIKVFIIIIIIIIIIIVIIIIILTISVPWTWFRNHTSQEGPHSQSLSQFL